MTTLIPALLSFSNLASSQLIFTNPWSGGFHFCTKEWAVRGEGGCGLTSWNSRSRSFANGVIKCRLQLGLFSRTWFRCIQIDHAVTEKSTRWCWWLINHDSNSLKVIKLSVFQQLHMFKSSQTASNSPHDHNAWRADSLAHKHRTQRGFVGLG